MARQCRQWRHPEMTIESCFLVVCLQRRGCACIVEWTIIHPLRKSCPNLSNSIEKGQLADRGGSLRRVPFHMVFSRVGLYLDDRRQRLFLWKIHFIRWVKDLWQEQYCFFPVIQRLAIVALSSTEEAIPRDA